MKASLRPWAAGALALGSFGGFDGFGGLGPVFAQTAPQTQTVEAVPALPRVEITGSSIPRAEAQGPVPVVILRRRDIERTGASTVSELMRSLPMLDLYEQGEQAPNSPGGSGTSNFRLRGLGESDVLVLLNGRRLPVNALHDTSGAGAAVDVNAIPLGMIERIEFMKDGGSALYGADAVAGVVNFITRRDYRGASLSVGAGQASAGDGDEKQASVAAGIGDLEQQGWNLMLDLEAYERSPIYRRDRDLTRSSDFRRFGGGDRRSFLSPAGNLIDPDTLGLLHRTLRPCPAADLDEEGACRYDGNAQGLTAINGAARLGGLLLGTLRLGPDLEASLQAIQSSQQDRFETPPVGAVFVSPAGESYLGRLVQAGPRTVRRSGSLGQWVVGLRGRAAEAEWKLDAGVGRSRVVNRGRNYFDAARLRAAVRDGRIDPTLSTNDPALLDALRVTPTRTGVSKNRFVDTLLTGELGAWPAGPVGYAVGASWWQDSLSDLPDPLQREGGVLGDIKQSRVRASRDAAAVYGELALPLAERVEAQLAARYDRYPGASQLSPKLALRAEPIPGWGWRASVSGSFRMPSLKQLYGGEEQGAEQFANPALCTALGQPADCEVSGYHVDQPNRALKPERGRTLNLGSFFDTAGGFSGSIDFWQLSIRNHAGLPTSDQSIEAGRWAVRDGNLYVYRPLLNIARSRTRGIDIDLEQRLSLPSVGQLTLSNTTTRVLMQREDAGDGAGWVDNNGLYPGVVASRWRNRAALSLERGAWQSTLALRSVSGFVDADEAEKRAGARRVGSHHELDLTIGWAGARGWRVDAGILNLLDRMPPFSEANTDPSYTGLGHAEIYSVRGRFLYARLTREF